METCMFTALLGTRLEASAADKVSHLFTLLFLYGSSSALWPCETEAMCSRGKQQPHNTLTMTNTHTLLEGTAGVRRWAGNGMYPLLEAISCSWVKLGLFVHRSEHFVCMCHIVMNIPDSSDDKEEFLKGAVNGVVSCWFNRRYLLFWLSALIRNVCLVLCTSIVC